MKEKEGWREMRKKCLNCGKEFETNHASQKFCSYLCYRLYVRKQMEKLKEEGGESG